MKLFARAIQHHAERKLAVRSDYLGKMGETSFSGLLKFLFFLPLAAHGPKTEKSMLHAVRIVATQHEDCGPCVQIAVNAAIDDRLEPELLTAVLSRRHEEMPELVSLAVSFTESVLERNGRDEFLRTRIIDECGEAVLTELSLAIASARVFPTIKRGMGYAESCSLAVETAA